MLNLCRTGTATLSILTLVCGLTGCRAPDGQAEAWPQQQPHIGSVLDQTTVVPGRMEQRAPTAPPSPRTTPRTPLEEPAPHPVSPQPPGIPEPLSAAQMAEGDGPTLQSPPPVEERTPPAAQDGMQELFPHVRADVDRRIIEFDGIVPIDAHDERAPRVYLEVTVCTPDTKEHESLVMTRARPSHVHAALLAIGLSPGNPGGFRWEDDTMTTLSPEGDPVIVTFIYRDADGRKREIPATTWVVNAETGKPFANGDDSGGFVFAGSVMRERQGREMYDADGIGTLVGLTTFGAETIAWREVISPDSHIHTPEWIADSETIPPFGSEVAVRIRPGK
jgi:hypothetical protein